MWNSDNLEEVRSSEIESHFNEIQYQVTRRRHLKKSKRIGTLRALVLQKIETPRNLRIKNRDCETHTTAKKQVERPRVFEGPFTTPGIVI